MSNSKLLHIRNFCIIAHIDHGKSTLADRLLELTKTLDKTTFNSQVLDNMDIEQERGITIKSHPIQMYYESNDDIFKLNLIDTPGHVDFTYEVSRSMAACEGALLLIDCTQGVEAQTVSNTYLAIENDLEIIPVINKIDMKNADIASSENQIIELLGCNKEDILYISSKEGTGVDEIFSQVIERIPPPTSLLEDSFSALIFDSYYDQYRGVIIYVRIFSGFVKKGLIAKFFNYYGTHEILEVGILQIDRVKKDILSEGDVGYLIINIKDVSNIKVGDTITTKDNPCKNSLSGYKIVKPMVFSGLYPIESKDYEDLKVSLDRLKLNDSSLSYEPNTSIALGFGFRCGFLGPLHMEIVQERLEREFNIDLITTCPNVSYNVILKDKSEVFVDNPSEMPILNDIDEIYEPYIKAEIIVPKEYIGNIMSLCTKYRGKYLSTNYLSIDRVQLVFEMPLAEIIYDFFENLKSTSRGYASLDYELIEKKAGHLIKLDIKVAGEIIDALSIIVHKNDSHSKGRILCKRLKNEIDRHQFEIPIQATIGQKVIARETIKALRKNVTAKCYGGDISRKRKLLEKQKAGKKRMKQVGNVQLPQEAFLAILKTDTTT
jgi:GTP-binding protein LepA